MSYHAGTFKVLASHTNSIPPHSKLLKEHTKGLKNLTCYRESTALRPSNQTREDSLLLNPIRCSNSESVALRGLPARKGYNKTLSTEATRQEPVRTLLIDNYDSYTYNLYQLLSVINGVEPVVVRNNDITWDDLCRLLYEERAFHNVVISPGPGSPRCASDVGICTQLLRDCHDIPILGVCLGYQTLSCVHGAEIVHAPEPVHGQLSEIEHSEHPLFANIPSGVNSGFKVVRYHSLMIDAATLPECLVPTAWTVGQDGVMGLEDCESGLMAANSEFEFECENEPYWQGIHGAKLPEGKLCPKVLMGVSHKSWPHHGVQFHPESVATEYGKQILENFQKLTLKFWEEQLLRPRIPSSGHEGKGAMRSNRAQPYSLDGKISRGKARNSAVRAGELTEETKHCSLHWQKLSGLLSMAGGSKTLFCKLFADEAVDDTFWLDSSTQEQGRACFSIMGGRGGPLWQRITYHITHGTGGGVLRVENVVGLVRDAVIHDGFLDFLDGELQLRQCRTEDCTSLPFDFCGGFVGYLGYELKAECGAQSNLHKSPMPDAAMFFVDRMVVADHRNDDVYVLALFQDGPLSLSLENSKISFEDSYSPNNSNSLSSPTKVAVGSVNEKTEFFSATSSLSAESHVESDLRTGLVGVAGERARRLAKVWVEEIARKVTHLAQQDQHTANERMHGPSLVSSLCTTTEDLHPPFVADKTKIGYIRDVKRCQEFIKDGESYEVCLTTQFRRKMAKADCLGLYLTLRDTNPAPYSSWLQFGKDGPSICSSSPERFLRLDRMGVLEAKPIKGTIPRGQTLLEDERLRHELQHSKKDQAENLMIVDLFRNDLGRVCEPGTVHVPSLMAVESYSTVHSMVSTVRGTRRLDVTPVDCVKAAFPGGSMTGAPKVRTMEIIDSLERSARGVYSGSIGYFSLNSCFDLNIVIRTLVIHEDQVSLGAGGAVIALSDPKAEYEEMLLKTRAPMRAVRKYESFLKDQPPRARGILSSL